MAEQASEIERLLGTYRGELDGQQWSNNDLLQRLSDEQDSQRRQAIWEALKQVGGVVAPRLRDLARLRNRGARRLGFSNYWELQIRLQEHDPDQLIGLFDELEQLTRQPFTEVKAEMDRELATRFGVDVDQLMPWHYDNPFFQAPPPSAAVDLDDFYRDKTREEIVEIARGYFAAIGLPVDDILRRSDLYEREGKDQHAFCMDVDRAGDVRTLCNVKPTAEWMDTVLHELGHAVYDVGIDRDLPFNLRTPSHAFTTEGVAMLFGALGKTPGWMVRYAGADPSQARRLAAAIRSQRRREQLIFARWTMVMLHFEKSLYENPDQDLNTLWWDYVERFQQLKRPANRDQPDWAAKPHFTIAPVYYHNYMMGELFAAQLRHTLFQAKAEQAVGSNETAAADDSGNAVREQLDGNRSSLTPKPFFVREDFGKLLRQRVVSLGNLYPWPEFVQRASGEPLTARYFAAEVTGGE
jgi:peptidyl-dipeptidase A